MMDLAGAFFAFTMFWLCLAGGAVYAIRGI